VETVCPACNKANNEETHCSRCGADLSALVKIRRSAALALKIGAQYLKQNDGRSALHQAEVSWHLKNSTEAARLAFLACLHLQLFEAATRWYELAIALENNPADVNF
jgi:Tfp pilus assembly protein PilF